MFFVRAHTADGNVDVLPWVHRSEGIGPPSAEATESYFPSRSVEIRSTADLSLLRDAVDDVAYEGTRLRVHLRPSAEVLHDKTFLDEVIQLCPAQRCTVELAGSTLSHAYYELVRGGAQVKLVDPIEPADSEPTSFGKLVRDLIPERIAAKGERVRAYTASGEELEELLKEKMLEEAFEVAAAQSVLELIEEVGDVLDVLTALCAVVGTNLATVQEWAESKRRERGGFERGYVLLDTREPSLDEAVSAGPAEYPVTRQVRAEVERRRTRRRDELNLSARREIKIPYSAPNGAEPHARVLVDGTEVNIRFVPSGLVLSRVESPPDADQLTLDMSPPPTGRRRR
jgi:predicted house-cleaning noncanonical NTP pyrophosphatase (MazG superfamily)